MRHTDTEYEHELRELRERLLLMAGRVEEMIAQSVKAVMTRNPYLANATIESDKRVNQDEIKIDELCLIILAKRQPVASDLRFVTLALKMVTDIERIGDLAVNVCERAIKLSDKPELQPINDISVISALVQSMIKDAIQAFVVGDPKKAQLVIDRDDEVDHLYQKIFRDILEIMIKDPSVIEQGIEIQSVAKLLERMADHSTNLAEQVIFMVKGKDVRNHGKLETNNKIH